MPIRLLLLLLMIFASTGATSAAEPVYPPGSRIGLEPPAELTVSRGFLGFEDAQNKVVMLFAELPPQAYEPTLKNIADAGKGGQGTTNVKREVLLTRSGAGQLIAGDQQVKNKPTRKWILLTPSSAHDFIALVTLVVPAEARNVYSDAKVRQMLSTVSLRSEVPTKEILSLLPFEMTELAQFRHVRPVAIGRAVLLTDEYSEAAAFNGPQMIVSINPGGPLESDDRARFSERLLVTIPGLKDTRKTFSEPQRIGGLPGYEIRLEGKDAKTGEDIVVVQWVRFGTNSFIRMVAMAPKDRWQEAFTRFRSVRDGIAYR